MIIIFIDNNYGWVELELQLILIAMGRSFMALLTLYGNRWSVTAIIIIFINKSDIKYNIDV